MAIAVSAVNAILPDAAPGEAGSPLPTGVRPTSTANCGCNKDDNSLGMIASTAATRALRDSAASPVAVVRAAAVMADSTERTWLSVRCEFRVVILAILSLSSRVFINVRFSAGLFSLKQIRRWSDVSP